MKGVGLQVAIIGMCGVFVSAVFTPDQAFWIFAALALLGGAVVALGLFLEDRR